MLKEGIVLGERYQIISVILICKRIPSINFRKKQKIHQQQDINYKQNPADHTDSVFSFCFQ